MRRTMDATFLNTVANHPEVRPWLGGEGALDLAPALANPANIGLETDQGGWVLTGMLPSVYELHTLFLPEGRGAPYFDAARLALRYVFAETDALELVTKCPDDNGAARFAAAKVGFRERFHRDDAFGPGVGISYQVFSLDDWFMRDPECLAEGRRFHQMIDTAAAVAGVKLPEHPHDETHDRAAGAAALMVQAGMTAKGVAFYNRWALFAGYPLIAALGQTIIDMHEVVVEVRQSGIVPLLWRPTA